MSIASIVGKTSFVKLERISEILGADIWVKLEGKNPAGSVKDRAALYMIQAALKSGELTKDKTIIEPTSGNMGISIAAIGASLGIKVVLTMPDTMSVERRSLIAGYGAEVILTPGAQGMKGAIEKAQSILDAEPDKYFMPLQFNNHNNALAHEETTGPEIDEALGGKIDVFLAGVGTGGTVTGVSRYFKKKKKQAIHSVAVEPTESPVLTQKRNGEELKPSKHGIQGIGAGFVPVIMDLDLMDEIITVSTPEALEYAKRLTREEGITSGISGGSNIAAIFKLVESGDYKGKTIVTVIPDGGEKYLSTALFAQD